MKFETRLMLLQALHQTFNFQQFELNNPVSTSITAGLLCNVNSILFVRALYTYVRLFYVCMIQLDR